VGKGVNNMKNAFPTFFWWKSVKFGKIADTLVITA
jgi:hypothetical protein